MFDHLVLAALLLVNAQAIPGPAKWEITVARVEAAARLTDLRLSPPDAIEARLMQRPWSATSPLPVLQLVRMDGRVRVQLFVFWAPARVPPGHQPQGDAIASRDRICVKPIPITERRDWEQGLTVLATANACSPSAGVCADCEPLWVKTSVNGQYQEQSCPQPRPDSLVGTLLLLMKESARSAGYGF